MQRGLRILLFFGQKNDGVGRLRNWAFHYFVFV